MSGATFTGNTATASGHGGYPAAGGGAIFSINATLVVSNSTFTNNQAPSGGGGAIEQAVSNDENEIGSLTVSGSTFSGNVAEAAGAIQDAITTMNVSNSTFTSNSGTLYAGAIDNEVLERDLDPELHLYEQHRAVRGSDQQLRRGGAGR